MYGFLPVTLFLESQAICTAVSTHSNKTKSEWRLKTRPEKTSDTRQFSGPGEWYLVMPYVAVEWAMQVNRGRFGSSLVRKISSCYHWGRYPSCNIQKINLRLWDVGTDRKSGISAREDIIGTVYTYLRETTLEGGNMRYHSNVSGQSQPVTRISFVRVSGLFELYSTVRLIEYIGCSILETPPPGVWAPEPTKVRLRFSTAAAYALHEVLLLTRPTEGTDTRKTLNHEL